MIENMPVAYFQDSKRRTERKRGSLRLRSERSETKERIPPGVPYLSGPLAQLVEHLTLNQGVTGSIPVRLTISARVAELADALDLGSSGGTPIGVQVPSLAPEKIQILE